MFTIFPVRDSGGIRECHKFIGGVYLHGDISDKPKTDLIEINEVFVDDFINLSDGIYDVTVYFDIDDKQEAVMYFWTNPGLRYGDKELRGLICAKTDKEYIEDAKNKFKERDVWL